MRYIPEISFLAEHSEWVDYDKDHKYFIPVDGAPPEVVEAIRSVNEKIKNGETM